MILSPIVLFVYNRPDHTLRTLTSLQNNLLADKSTLYIYCDGPKSSAQPKEIENIRRVRKIVRSFKWCLNVEIIERTDNFGLSKSIITGVTEIVKKHGKVIVLEDDIVTSKGFLTYMNEALNKYENYKNIMHVSGYFYPIKLNISEETFFLTLGTCWGWATWATNWDKFESSSEILYEKIISMEKREIQRFDNRNNSLRLLRKTKEGKVDSWAIRWYASIFLNQGLGLHPHKSLVQNIGFDGSGTHFFALKSKPVEIVNEVNVENILIEKSVETERRLRKYFLLQRIKSAPTYYLNKFKC